jgi:hypothetical protein
MIDESDSPKVSPFSQSTAIGRQRIADAERSMHNRAHRWDGKAIAGAIVLAAARELILETPAGSLVLFDPVRQLHGAQLAVGDIVRIAADGRHTHIERERGLGR